MDWMNDKDKKVNVFGKKLNSSGSTVNTFSRIAPSGIDRDKPFATVKTFGTERSTSTFVKENVLNDVFDVEPRRNAEKLKRPVENLTVGNEKKQRVEVNARQKYKGKKSDLRDLVAEGHMDDIKFLSVKLSDEVAKSSTSGRFILKVPTDGLLSETRLVDWLEQLGFVEEAFVAYRAKPMMLASSKVEELTKVVDSVLQERSASSATDIPILTANVGSTVPINFSEFSNSINDSRKLTIKTDFSALDNKLIRRPREPDLSPVSIPPTPLALPDNSPIISSTVNSIRGGRAMKKGAIVNPLPSPHIASLIDGLHLDTSRATVASVFTFDNISIERAQTTTNASTPQKSLNTTRQRSSTLASPGACLLPRPLDDLEEDEQILPMKSPKVRDNLRSPPALKVSKTTKPSINNTIKEPYSPLQKAPNTSDIIIKKKVLPSRNLGAKKAAPIRLTTSNESDGESEETEFFDTVTGEDKKSEVLAAHRKFLRNPQPSNLFAAEEVPSEGDVATTSDPMRGLPIGSSRPSNGPRFSGHGYELSALLELGENQETHDDACISSGVGIAFGNGYKQVATRNHVGRSKLHRTSTVSSLYDFNTKSAIDSFCGDVPISSSQPPEFSTPNSRFPVEVGDWFKSEVSSPCTIEYLKAVFNINANHKERLQLEKRKSSEMKIRRSLSSDGAAYDSSNLDPNYFDGNIWNPNDKCSFLKLSMGSCLSITPSDKRKIGQIISATKAAKGSVEELNELKKLGPSNPDFILPSMHTESHMLHLDGESGLSTEEDEPFSGDIMSICKVALSQRLQPGESKSPDKEVDTMQDEIRKKKKLQKSAEKWKRMSIGFNLLKKPKPSLFMPSLQDLDENTKSGRPSHAQNLKKISPGVKAKVGRKSVVFMNDIPKFPKSKLIEEPNNLYMKHQSTLDAKLTERKFRGRLIGGIYQQCFDANGPVIASPSNNDERVLSLKLDLESEELVVRLYNPLDNSRRQVTLPSTWVFTRASPQGFVISKEPLVCGKVLDCYFTMKHPQHCDDIDSIVEMEHEMSVCSIKNLNQSTMSAGSGVHELSFASENSADMNNECLDNDTYGETSRSNWNNSYIISNILQFLIATPDPVVSSSTKGSKKIKTAPKAQTNDYINYMSVSKAWALACYQIFAASQCKIDSQELSTSSSFSTWSKFMTKYNSGRFISEGACKQVYCIHNPSTNTMEAMSVMDIDDLMARGMDDAITQELQISMMCSSLNKLNICPNLVQVHSIFQSEFGPSDRLWRNSQVAKQKVVIPKQNEVDKGRFQYIRMEFCDGGDMEELVRKFGVIDVELMRSFLFQMVFSLFSSRDQLSLRHYDLKLLNFFVASGKALLNRNGAKLAQNKSRSSFLKYRVGFGPFIYALPLALESPQFAKLADYGTSAIGLAGLGDPITMQQFTTLENTPPEFFFMGSNARQSYAADTFCLGLSWLHLLTGREPYEVLLDNVKCPTQLIAKLRNVWHPKEEEDPFFVIHEVIDSLEEPEDPSEPKGVVMYHTLYRYMVLFCKDINSFDHNMDDSIKNSPVWKVVMETLFPTSRRTACANTYKKDCEQWSIKFGSDPVMVGVRNRLHSLGGNQAVTLFEKLVNFDPSERCTMQELLLSSVFNAFREDNIVLDIEPYEERVHEASFMHYYKPNQGLESLPNV